jgi:DNA repair exonuclease SbcCD nuclease subunit
MGIKILHTADIHIGLRFSGRDYPSALKDKLISEPLNTLERMIVLANSKKCDLFVIAGDMFDKIGISKAEVKRQPMYSISF